jgi:hypothetical protein
MPASVSAIASVANMRRLALFVGLIQLLFASPLYAQTELGTALRNHSFNGEALPELYPVLASELLYFASGCDGIENIGEVNADRQIAFAVASYRDGQLFYAFDSEALLDQWAVAVNAAETTCWVAFTGRQFVDLMGPDINSSYTVLNIETAPVLITPDDWAWVDAR